uniref:Uncharacterized protein n=1 Tax=Trichobilharzia regenti TaxID=157069 RepID=A0AA85J205_TRIRE|nr:unnamed protein product [Trichobilharzia regenti]
MSINVNLTILALCFSLFAHALGLVYHTLRCLAYWLLAMSTNRSLQVVNLSERIADLNGIFGELILGRRLFSWDEFEKSLAEFQKVRKCSVEGDQNLISISQL